MELAKVTIFGNASAGKSSIIQRFITNSFDENNIATIGATFLTKVMDFDKKSIKLSIWDTAGQERYHSLAVNYARDSQACILVYDITNRDSFESLSRWHNSIKDYIEKDTFLFVVGNKEDLVEREVVKHNEVLEFSDGINACFMKTSAKLGTGIDELFCEIAKKILNDKDIIENKNFRATRGLSLAANRNNIKKKDEKAKCC